MQNLNFAEPQEPKYFWIPRPTKTYQSSKERFKQSFKKIGQKLNRYCANTYNTVNSHDWLPDAFNKQNTFNIIYML